MRCVGVVMLVVAVAVGHGVTNETTRVTAAPAQLVYDFEHLVDGPLHGQDGWVTVNTGTAGSSQRHQVESAVAAGSAPAGYDGSRAVTYRYSGSGVGGRASRVNDATFSAMTIRPSGVTVIEIEMERTHWGSSLRLGRDANADGDLDNDEVALAVLTRGDGANKSRLQLPSGMAISTTAIGSFNRYQVAIDRTRERASLWFRDLSTTPAGAWTAAAGIVDVATGFTTDGSSSDPTTWDAIGLQTEGNRGFFDNLKFRWVDVSTRAVNFGDRRDGSVGSDTVMVSGEYLTGALSAEIIGDALGEFTFVGGSTSVAGVQAGTVLDLRFAPKGVGQRTATLRIHGEDMLAPLDVSLTAGGFVYVDDDFDGGGWQLIAYAANGVLPGPLTAAAGTYDPIVRAGGAVLGDALARVQASSQMAITWAQSGTPTGGLASYTNGLWFTLPTPAAMSLAGSATGSFTAVSVNTVTGPWGGPSTMYLRADTFGVNYGNSLGLVGSLTAGNPGVDWHADTQDRAAVYLSRNQGGTLPAFVTPSRAENGFTPSQMAIWVRNVPAAPTITGITSGDGNLTVAFTDPPGINGQIREIEYRLDGGAWTSRTPTSAASPLVLTGLAEGSVVDVEIRAVNAVGPGAASTPMTGTVTVSPPPPPVVVDVAVPVVVDARSGLILSPEVPVSPRSIRTALGAGRTGVSMVGALDAAAPTAIVDTVSDQVRVRAGELEAVLAVVDDAGARMPADPDGVITVDEGGLVEVEVRGLAAGVEGQVVVASDPVVIGTFLTDAAGRIAGSAPLPPGLAPGLHTLWLLTDEVEISVGLRVRELAMPELATGEMLTGGMPAGETAASDLQLPTTGVESRLGDWVVLMLALGGVGVLLGRRRVVASSSPSLSSVPPTP